MDQLAASFSAHRIVVSRHDDWLVPNETSGPYIRALLSDSDTTPNGASVRLDVQVVVSEEYVVLESFGGFGTTTAEAESNAFENFVRSSFHVILAAFYDCLDSDQVEVERWSLSGVDYGATIGNYTIRSFQGNETPIPEQAFSTLKSLIRNLPATEDWYWVRLFYCNQDEDTRVTEVLLNNEEWDAAQIAIAAVPWERRPWFYSARAFLVLRRSKDTVESDTT